MLGDAWKTLEIVDKLEKTMGVSVVHAAAARCWETRIRLGLRQPIPGYGRLLAEMPEAAELGRKIEVAIRKKSPVEGRRRDI